jgi:orotate phosphoribosyltransferase-like protein
MSLFRKNAFVSHSGIPLEFKIECDALTEEDWKTLAYIVSKRFQFRSVFGVPEGGRPFEMALRDYTSDGAKHVLIVDDVLTTGNSMEQTREVLKQSFDYSDIIGVVVFARGETAHWIHPIFQMWG